jgi:hypothetical protein
VKVCAAGLALAVVGLEGGDGMAKGEVVPVLCLFWVWGGGLCVVVGCVVLYGVRWGKGGVKCLNLVLGGPRERCEKNVGVWWGWKGKRNGSHAADPHAHTCIYAYIDYIHTYIPPHPHIYIHVYIYSHTHIYIHIYT